MHCVWCDTPHAIGDTTRHYDEYALDELMDKISQVWDDCHSVSLTGGEPLVQSNFLKVFLPRLRQDNKPNYLETNGIFYKELEEIIEDVDIIAMDIKLPSSAKCQPFFAEHEAFLKIALKKDVFIKTVISSDTEKSDIDKSVDFVSRIDPNVLFILQPNYFDMHNGVMTKCLEYQSRCLDRLRNVRIIPQIHKFMKLR
jgi:7-carboxy-7-deazaguanine synthase